MSNLRQLKITFMNGEEVTLDGEDISFWRWTSEDEDGDNVPRLIVRSKKERRPDMADRIEYPAVNIRRVGVFTKAV